MTPILHDILYNFQLLSVWHKRDRSNSQAFEMLPYKRDFCIPLFPHGRPTAQGGTWSACRYTIC
jgi:hypothetical protein